MSKKKVLIVSEPGSGGVARHVIDLLGNLNKDKFDVFLIYSSKRADDNYLKNIELLKKDITVFKIDKMQQKIDLYNDFCVFKKILRIIKKIKPDVVHCHSSKAGVIGRIAAKVAGVKNIFYTPHAYAFQNPNLSLCKKKIFITIEKVMSKYFTDKTFNVSIGEKEIAIETLNDNEDKFVVINNGVDKKNDSFNIDELCKRYNIIRSDYIIGNISRLDEQKNPMEFFKIAQRIICDDSNMKFVWIGNGVLYEFVKNFINNNNIDDKCLLLPYNEQTEQLMNRFDLFLCTSLYEGYPYVLIDACVNEIPIVCSDVIGNNDIVVENVNGFLYTLGDIDQAVNMISKTKNTLFKKCTSVKSVKEMVHEIEANYTY